jgi:hypothetical protein
MNNLILFCLLIIAFVSGRLSMALQYALMKTKIDYSKKDLLKGENARTDTSILKY